MQATRLWLTIHRHSASRPLQSLRFSLGLPMVALGWLALTANAAETPATAQEGSHHWVRGWGSALMAPQIYDEYPDIARTFQNATLRQVIVPTRRGSHMRLWLSNEFGTRPLVLGAAHVAIAGADSATVDGTDRMLLFNGQPTVVIPVGAAVVSDVFVLSLPLRTPLAVSLYLPKSTEGSPNSVHGFGWHDGYVATAGNFARMGKLPVSTQLHGFYYLSGLDVEVDPPSSTIVALGDSITDGVGSTPGAGHSWPEYLSKRLEESRPDSANVINMGISGNRLLHDLAGPSALSRIDRDLFSIPGVRVLIVLEGVNDIAGAENFARADEDVSAEELIGALRQLVDRAHEHGMRVLGGTLTPTGGCPYPGYDSPVTETKRQVVNAWIRSGRAFDAVVDFDRTLRDPAAVARIKREFDSGDHIHPNDAGYSAMAEAIDLSQLN